MQPSPGSATRQVNNQLQEGCQYSSKPVLQQWWNKQPSPGSATRQVNNQLQEVCQYSSKPVLQQWWNNATISGFRHQASN
jgi:hypothetical protein